MVNIRSIKTITLIMLLIGLLTSLIYWQLSFIPIKYEPDKYLLEMGNNQYDLYNPNMKYVLPEKLVEISGLSYFKPNKLACVQDEDGIIFIYDTKNQQISYQEKFGKKGDFEGIEIVRDTAYILKSNGEIYYFSISENEIGETQILETKLSSKNDTEGLCYYPQKDRLLIACKGNSSTKNHESLGQSVHTVNLAKKKFISSPTIEFSNQQLKKALKRFDLDPKKHLPFKPSAITVNPITNEVAIISSVGRLLIVIDKQHNITAAIPLKRKIFSQPEGICFDSKGTLYISNEGRSQEGYILQFNPL